MEWFRRNYGATTMIGNRLKPASEQPLPSVEGVVSGILKNIRNKTKDGVIVCGATADKWANCEVFIFRELVAASGASVGDRLGFCIHENHEGKPQASFPIWREVSSLPAGPRDCDGTFPKHMGTVTQIGSSGDFGYVEAPSAQDAYGKAVFVQKVLLGGIVSVGDVVAFDIRLNGKGNPQATAPLFKLYSKSSNSSTKSPLLKPAHPEHSSVPTRAKYSSKSASQIADWTALPGELLPRVLATSGPAELCRFVAVCRDWDDAMGHFHRDLEHFWKALCAEVFPSMTAKLLASSEADLAAATKSIDGIQTGHEDEDIVEVSRVGNFHPPTRREHLRHGYWRQMFFQRYMKQRAWDVQRSSHRQELLRKSELLQQQASAADKQRGQNFRGQASQSEIKSQRTLRSVRMRTCKKCGSSFIPGSGNAVDACYWHRGSYSCVDEDGVLANSSCQVSQAVVQRAIQENSKKKRKPIMLRPPGITTGRWKWMCCGAENMLATGCCCSPHT